MLSPSLYNFFHLEKIIDFFKDKEYIKCISFMNITNRPPYVDIQLLPEKIFYSQIEKYKKKHGENSIPPMPTY